MIDTYKRRAISALDSWLARFVSRDISGATNKIRDAARTASAPLGLESEFKQLDKIIGALWRHTVQENRKIIASSGGAVGLNVFASFIGLCCIGPWTVALLGVSGAVSMARWQPLRPYILGVAGIQLAWGFWRAYRLR